MLYFLVKDLIDYNCSIYCLNNFDDTVGNDDRCWATLQITWQRATIVQDSSYC